MRHLGLDLSRGLLMIYIVVVLHGVVFLSIIPKRYWSLILLEMPLVFLVSGYTFALTRKNKQGSGILSYWKFARSRVTRILIPYFAYAIACVLFKVLFINDSTDFPEIIASWMNPWNLGNGHTWFCLNWHLWFIPAFLAVTLIFPLIKSRALSKISDAFLLALICAVFVALSFSRHWFMSTVAFYLIWYFLGYKLESDWKISNRQLLVLAVSGVIVLVVGVTKFQATLDMQVHKFPPNYMFLGFSAIWVSMALFLAPKVPQGWIDFLADNWFVKLFISRGYSLYLWQGLGYATAVLMAHKMGWNVFFTWLVAVLITIVLGTLAAPLERVRWKQTLQTDRRYQVGTSKAT